VSDTVGDHERHEPRGVPTARDTTTTGRDSAAARDASAPARHEQSILLRRLEKRFGTRRALAGIDLALSGPQLVGIVGADGAGKTTLLRTIAGLLEFTAEEARVLGVDLAGDVRELKAQLGYVPQSFSLHRDLSVIENLRFTARLHRLPAADLERRARELLERTGLAPFAHRAAGALSGGMKQKLAIANALLPEPALLVLDEPTAGVDVVARGEIWTMLQARRADTLILLSTSYLDETAACDRLVYLDAGRVVASGTPAELRATAALELYRAWGDDARAIAVAARALPYVADAHAAGRYARVAVPLGRTPGAARVLVDLAALPHVRVVEQRAVDIESTLLALAHKGARDGGDAEGELGERRERPELTSGRDAHRERSARGRRAMPERSDLDPGRDVAIRAAHLTKRFGDFTAVDDLSFTVAPGSIFAFLGANGSGKSTTIRMLIGLLTPTAGSVEVAGIDVVRTPRHVRDMIGYMGQRVSLYAGLTLRENLEFYAGLYGLAGAVLEQRWGALRERFGLAEAEHENASDLPAGLRQRAGLALSTLHRPRILFLDEPTAGVDIQNRLRFWDLIQEEAESGVTVFVTTHFLEEVEYCDWVCFIDAGKLIANATPDAIRRRYSEGYRMIVRTPADARDAALAAWRDAGLDPTPSDGDGSIVVRTPVLTPRVFDLLASTGRKGADGRLQIEQPEMAGLFRGLMLEAHGGGAPRDDAAAHRDAAAVATDGDRDADAPDVAPDVAAYTSDSAPSGLRSDAAPSDGAAAPIADGVDTRASTPSGLAVRWRRLRTLMRREARATLRDPFTVTMLIAVPLGALLAFGYTLAVNVKDLALGVHDASGTAASRRLVAELAANGTFAPRRFATRDRVERALVAGRISAAVIIPPDFDRELREQAAGGRPAEIQVLYDGGETVVAGNAEGFLQGIAAATGTALVRDQRIAPGGGERTNGGGAPPRAGTATSGVKVVTRVLFNPTLDGTPFMVAGTFGFVLTFLTTLITAVSIVNEKLTGTFEQLQVTPATSGEIVLGKILPLGAVFALDVVLMVTLGGVLLGVWPKGSLVFFIVVACFYLLISLALGLIFSATSATAAEAVQKTVLFSIPLNFLGGFIFPVRNMPFVFRQLAQVLPATHFIEISRAIYLRAAGPLALLPRLALLGLFGVILMAMAFRTVARRA